MWISSHEQIAGLDGHSQAPHMDTFEYSLEQQLAKLRVSLLSCHFKALAAVQVQSPQKGGLQKDVDFVTAPRDMPRQRSQSAEAEWMVEASADSEQSPMSSPRSPRNMKSATTTRTAVKRAKTQEAIFEDVPSEMTVVEPPAMSALSVPVPPPQATLASLRSSSYASMDSLSTRFQKKSEHTYGLVRNIVMRENHDNDSVQASFASSGQMRGKRNSLALDPRVDKLGLSSDRLGADETPLGTSSMRHSMLETAQRRVRSGFYHLFRIKSDLHLKGDKHFTFVDSFMAIVIILNAIAIGLSSDIHREWLGWAVIDTIFASIFTVELLYKFKAQGLEQYFMSAERQWNIFEFILVVMAWAEVISAFWAESWQDTPAYSLIRIFRLIRITKIIRVLRLQVFSDLLMMINGAVGSVKTLFYSVVLVSVPLYMVALVLCESLRGVAEEERGAESFASLSLSFFNVFRCVVGGECTREDGSPIFLIVTTEYGWVYGVIYCITLVLMTIGLFNVIVAIYVENIVTAAKYNDLSLKRKRLQDMSFFCAKAEELIRHIWTHHQVYSGMASNLQDAVQDWDAQRIMAMKITRQFFEEQLKQSKFKDILGELDIADEDQLDLFDTLDGDGSGFIDIIELIQGLGKLRGEARRADIISVNLIMQNMYVEFRTFRDEMRHHLMHTSHTLGQVVKRQSQVDQSWRLDTGRNNQSQSSGGTMGVRVSHTPPVSTRHSMPPEASLMSPTARRKNISMNETPEYLSEEDYTSRLTYESIEIDLDEDISPSPWLRFPV